MPVRAAADFHAPYDCEPSAAARALSACTPADTQKGCPPVATPRCPVAVEECPWVRSWWYPAVVRPVRRQVPQMQVRIELLAMVQLTVIWTFLSVVLAVPENLWVLLDQAGQKPDAQD